MGGSGSSCRTRGWLGALALLRCLRSWFELHLRRLLDALQRLGALLLGLLQFLAQLLRMAPVGPVVLDRVVETKLRKGSREVRAAITSSSSSNLKSCFSGRSSRAS